MLVLVSFGLVLLATILLIVGLFNDTLALIYLSIAASVAAAIVLFLAFRMAKPSADKSKTPPEPIEPEDSSEPTDSEAVASPSRPTPVSDDAEVAADDVTTVQPAVAAGSSDDDWMEDEDWDDAVVDFPIADYDDLTVAEVMPLLPQLYSDELDTVIERERAGKNRSTIIKRLQELKVSGTEADREDLGDDDGGAAAATQTLSEPAAAAAPLVELDDDEEDDWFPIADYDSLSVAQVVPLLDQLEPDELEDVRAKESRGSGRKTVLAEIDRLLSAEGATPAPAPEPAAAPSARGGGGGRLPIANYDELTVADIRPRLSDLSDSQLRTVLDHERSTSGRSSIIGEIERRLGGGASAASPSARPTKKAAKSGRATKKAAKSGGATKKAAKSAQPRFPIANYDDLTVSDIRPRLADLSERQLQLVRERELTGAGRKTILNDIESRLS